MVNGAFNSVSANYMNVTGILQASQIITTEPMQVSSLTTTGSLTASGTLGVTGPSTFGDINSTGVLNVTGPSTFGDINSTGVLDVTGSSTLDAPTLVNPTVQGDLTVSGNVYVGGSVITSLTLDIASVANSTGLIPNGQYKPDSQDVFYYENRSSVDKGTPGPLEHEYDINVPIFTNGSKTTYINNGTTYPSDPKSLLMEYITNNVYVPSFTSLSSASINGVYANVYSNANQTFGLKTHFSNQQDVVPFFTEENVNNKVNDIIGFYLDRGFTVPVPDYNVNYKNMFAGQIWDFNNDYPGYAFCQFTIEFGYGTNLSIPSNVYLTAVNYAVAASYSDSSKTFYSGFLPSYNALATTDSNVFIKPTVIPVTTDASVFSSAYGTATGKSALYDPTTSQIHIYFNGSSNTYGSGNTIPAFATGTGLSTITWNEVCELSHFEGSFAIRKKRAQITTSDRPFAMTNSVDPGAFLVQTSNNIIITSNVYRNGTQIFFDNVNYAGGHFYSSTVTNPMFNEAFYGSNYGGYVMPKVGAGSSNYDIYSYNQNIPNATSISLPVILFLEKNPYSEITMYNPIPSYSSLYNSNSVNWYGFTTYANVYTDTPEMLVANMGATITTANPDNSIEIILMHELSHGVKDYSSGMVGAKNMTNTEGPVTSLEMAYNKKKIPQLLKQGIRGSAWATYMNTSSRGAWPIGRTRSTYEGELHTLGDSAERVFGNKNAQYGESMLFNYISDHYDTNNQTDRHCSDLLQQKMKEGYLDAGFNTWTIFQIGSLKASHLVLDTSIQEVTTAYGSPTTLANVFTEFVVAQTMMRNNSTIPDKYKTLYPYWVLNRDAPWASDLSNIYYSGILTDTMFWSDAIDGVPIGDAPEANDAGYPLAINNLQNDTLVPIWPKEGSFGTPVPFSNGPVLNNLGSWADATYRDAWTYTSNTYINTPLVHQLEDMASFTYVIPTFSNAASNVYGTSHYVSNIAVVVTRGDWVFKVVQFVPNGGQGTFIEGPDMNVNVTDATFTLPSTWSGGTPQTIDINFGTMATQTTTSGGTTSTTGFQSECHGTDYHGVHVWYFPRLVCVNKKNHDYGPYRNVYPRDCIYSGYMTMQATIV